MLLRVVRNSIFIKHAVTVLIFINCVKLETDSTFNKSASFGQNQPSGSLGRWRYDRIYKKDEPLRDASSVNAQANVGNEVHVDRRIHQNSPLNVTRTTTPPTFPTVAPLVNPSARKEVQWFDDSATYGLNATYDYKFKIRYAPIPRAGSPWPMPQSYLPSTIAHPVNPDEFLIEVIGNSCPIVHTYFARIKRNMFGSCDEPSGTEKSHPFGFEKSHLFGAAVISGISVTILKKCTRYPHLDMDESYDIVIKSSGVSIVSNEVWGAMRGMETFSQLVYQDASGKYWVNESVVHDFPRFKHRGLLLDTSRHYLRKEVIINNLEAMAQNKLNVFHWHIVDDQSFPYESKVFPSLTNLGAYDQSMVYTHEDIAFIIEEARVRGIRVIPEFDSPGHTFSWGLGQKHLLTPCYDYNGQPNGKYGPVNPTLKKNYRFLKALFQEVMTVFKDKYVHLGGDEVPFECWLSNPFIQKFMKRNRILDIRKVLSLYERELLKTITEIGVDRKVGSGYIVWQEMFDNEVKLNPDTIVQVWSGDVYSVERVINSGLKAIFSTCWYLDYIGYGQDWDKYYRCDQLSYRTLNETLFIGGEVCMWTEYVDSEGITPRIWPRASAAAERLWSSHRVNDVHEASSRIEEQRCRMLRTGLQVGVLSGPGHCPGNVKRRAACANPVISTDVVQVQQQSLSYIVLPFVAVVILFAVAYTLLITSNRRRFISIIVHAFTGGTLQRKLVIVFVVFLGSWLVWWVMRQLLAWDSSQSLPSNSAF